MALGFVGFAPNRILSAKSVALWQAASPHFLAIIGAGLLLMIAGAFGWPRRLADGMVLVGAIAILLAVFAAAGEAATALVAEAGSASARISLGGAFWAIFATSALAISEALGRMPIGTATRILYGAAILVAVALLAAGGWFNDLSLVHEWANRRDEYAAALGDHVTLVATSLAISVAVGVPLGVWATLRQGASGTIFTILNLIQTIPSIALFGLLIGPLTALSEAIPGLREIGVRGIGFTPAVIALVLYGLLPIARNTEAGLRGVPRSSVDAARGMGMTPFQIMTRVSVPLALPALLAGLRIVTVQTIGLGVVAALIGAGGLGSFVFLGIGQTAMDLVLLGALSVILFALVADALLRVLTIAVTRNASP